MATEDLLGSAFFRQDNLTGSNSNVIDDDPDSSNDLWMTWDGNGNVDSIHNIHDPTTDPGGVTERQEFRVLIRKDSSGGNAVPWELGVWELEASTYSLLATIASGTVTSLTGEVVSGLWDASLLTTASGANVSVGLLQTAGGTGSPGSRRGVDISAYKWVSDDGAIGPQFPYHIIKQVRRGWKTLLTM